MCLSYVTRLNDKADRKVYKVLRVYNDGTLRSPLYSDTKWTIGHTNTLQKKDVDDHAYSGSEIHGGAYHTFQTVRGCIESGCCMYPFSGSLRIFEAVIPFESSHVFYGKCFYTLGGVTSPGYASDKLRIVRRVPDEEVLKACREILYEKKTVPWVETEVKKRIRK